MLYNQQQVCQASSSEIINGGLSPIKYMFNKDIQLDTAW